MPINTLVRNGNIIHTLSQNVANGIASINTIPKLVKSVIEENMWQNFVVKTTNEEVKYDSFDEFVAAPLGKGGLETTVDTILNLCCKDNTIRTLIDKVRQRPPGRPKKEVVEQQPCDPPEDSLSGDADFEEAMADLNTDSVEEILDNIQDSPQPPKAPTGTSKEAGLRRLRKDRPDLHQEVIDGKKSVHAACVEAGFRKKPKNIETAKRAVEKMTTEELQEFKQWLDSYLS